MSADAQDILDRAMNLSSEEKARLVDELLTSLHQPEEAIDALWRVEVEDRIKAYRAGTLKSVSLEDVLGKHRK